MSKDKKRLGRGLGALLEIEQVEVREVDVSSIPVHKIIPNVYQPRRIFDQEKMNELTQSIKEKGVIQPVIVRAREDRFELVAGERRWRAAKSAGLEEIPAVIRDFTDQDMMEIALIENLQREDLNVIEEAEAYQKLLVEFGFTQEELAERVGKSRSHVANTLRLLKLSPITKELLEKRQLSMGHARALLGVSNELRQSRLAQEAVARVLSVREIESLIKKEREKERQMPSKVRKQEVTDPNVRSVEETLEDVLGTRVKIENHPKKGRIVVEYYGHDDLERIVDLLKGRARG